MLLAQPTGRWIRLRLVVKGFGVAIGLFEETLTIKYMPKPERNKKKIQATTTDKWVILALDGKEVKFRKSSKNGIVMQSMINNPEGLKTSILELAIAIKEPAPHHTEEEQESMDRLISQYGVESLAKLTNWALGEDECDHVCTSDCRREGCNCKCGEFHEEVSFDWPIFTSYLDCRIFRLHTINWENDKYDQHS